MPGPRRWLRRTVCTRRCPGRPAETSTPAVDSSRPKLVLLRPTDDAAAADVDDGDGGHYERIGVLDRPEPECVPEVSADLSAFRREQAKRRCTTLLRCLCGIAISTGLIGMWPGDASRLGLHRPLGVGRPRPGRAHGLRQGDRGRAAPPPGPSRTRRGARSGAGATSTRRRPATPVPGTTTTDSTTRSPGSQHADGVCRGRSASADEVRRRSGRAVEPDYPGWLPGV